MILKTLRMQRMEAARGRPIEDILYDLYVRQNLTMEQVARELGVTTATVLDWLKRCHIPRRRIQFVFPAANDA